MIPALLLAFAQGPQPEMFSHPKMPLSDYKLPVLGGEQEIVLGIKNMKTQFYGYFARYGQVRNLIGNSRVTNPDIYEDDQVGYMSWSVATYPHGGQQAYLIQSDGTYKQAIVPKKKYQIGFINRAKVSYWVSLQGKLLQENSVISVSAGNWVLEADFHKDSYDLYVNNPYTGEKRSTVYPANGTADFDAMFIPMLAGGKDLVKEKTFFQLDPQTGAPVKYTATLGGLWSGKLFNAGDYHGRWIDLEGGGKKQRIYVSDDGRLYRVDEPEQHYLSITEVPQDHASG